MGNGLKNHPIQLKNLRENEVILHNCTSHPLIHLKSHLFYIATVLLPFVGIMIMDQRDLLEPSRQIVWFLYACYGLLMTVIFFVKGINFELGGCVITNQRLLRFGYRGLIHAVEREILPKNISDFKVEKQGILSFLFNTATISIYTANNQIDVLRHVMEPVKIQDAYAKMARFDSEDEDDDNPQMMIQPTPTGADWIEQALTESKEELNMEHHRKGMIGTIGNVFKRKQ